MLKQTPDESIHDRHFAAVSAYNQMIVNGASYSDLYSKLPIYETVANNAGEYRLRNDVVVPVARRRRGQRLVDMGKIFYLTGADQYYMRLGEHYVASPPYYGPFDGNPASKLALAAPPENVAEKDENLSIIEKLRKKELAAHRKPPTEKNRGGQRRRRLPGILLPAAYPEKCVAGETINLSVGGQRTERRQGGVPLDGDRTAWPRHSIGIGKGEAIQVHAEKCRNIRVPNRRQRGRQRRRRNRRGSARYGCRCTQDVQLRQAEEALKLVKALDKKQVLVSYADVAAVEADLAIAKAETEGNPLNVARAKLYAAAA